MSAVPAGFPYRLTRNMMIAAGILYCSLLLEAVAGYPLDIHTSFLSELGARDQPTSLAARTTDLAASVLMLIAAVLARPAARMHRDVAGLLIGTAVFGLGTLFDSFWPMDCSPTASAACREVEAKGHQGTGLVIHEVTSSVAWLGTLVMCVFAVLVIRRIGGAGALGRTVTVLSVGVVGTNAVISVNMVTEALTGSALYPVGILQRIAVLFVCLVLGLLLPALRQGLRG